MTRSLLNRRDNRTVEKFASDIKFGTLRERRLIDGWREAAIRDEFFEQIEVEDNGIANDGELIEDTRGQSWKADFRVYVVGGDLLKDGTHLLEVKYTPCLWKATFKVFDLWGYTREKAHILLIFGDGRENPRLWTIVTPESIQKMIDTLPVSNSYPGMGGKPAVMVKQEQFPRFFGGLNPWGA